MFLSEMAFQSLCYNVERIESRLRECEKLKDRIPKMQAEIDKLNQKVLLLESKSKK